MQKRRMAALLATLAMALLAGCNGFTFVVVTLPSDYTSGIYGPNGLRHAYHINDLINRGYTGKGHTIIDMVCFGDPQVQHNLDMYDQEYHLPPVTVQVVNTIGPNPVATTVEEQKFQDGWAFETSLDVEMYHAIAPDAGIVVLADPVCTAEGLTGLPQARQELAYAIAHRLGDIVSVSGGTSELTLQDAASQAELKLWDALLQTATTKDGITFLVSTGDNGAVDYIDANATQLSTTPTVAFPADSPWVTAVGGTTLVSDATPNYDGTTSTNTLEYQESAWDSGNGGVSAFYAEPSYQQTLPAAQQTLLHGQRGVPDVAAVADPATGVRIYAQEQWLTQIGGTSVSAPIWAGLVAIADQYAGRSLGFINPALYAIAAANPDTPDFNDITSGDNSTTVNGTTVHGYLAGTGWDAITGLGTPDAATLVPDLITQIGSK
jgi:subtilase family serine protease